MISESNSRIDLCLLHEQVVGARLPFWHKNNNPPHFLCWTQLFRTIKQSHQKGWLWAFPIDLEEMFKSMIYDTIYTYIKDIFKQINNMI